MAIRQINFTDVIGPSFYKAWNDFYRGWYVDPIDGKKKDLREQVFSGGRGSLKSSAVSVFLIMGLERDAREAAQHMKEGDPRWRSYLTHGIIFRKFASDLATSVYGQMQWAISKLGLDDEYVCQKSPLKIVRRRTGQTILFRGLDDPTKVKSLKPPSGYGFFKYLWAEEWDQFDGMEEIRSVRQSVLRGGHKFQTFYSFNPPETSANWANFEVSKPVEGRLVYRSDYRSVPAEWLGENFFIEADLLRQNNERAYRHEYLGEVTGNGGSVFPNIVKRTITDAELRTYDRLYLGLDFGFALDPSAFSAMYYDKNHHRLILFDEIYKTNLRNIELSELIKEKPYVGFNYIMCDSAEPKSIADLESYGINALPVQKTERRFGFKWLQSLNEIVIDPVRTPNAFREFSLAEYGKSKSGEFISKYPEINDHYLDSCIVGNTMVNTPLGMFPIENLVGKSGKLFGYDSHGNVKETTFVNCRKTRYNSETIIIEIENSNTHINCTQDHKILTPDGYVQAGDLTIGSQVVTWSGIKKVSSKHDGRPQDVYDLEVPETHNFIVNEGLIIHNCRYATSEIAAQAGFC